MSLDDATRPRRWRGTARNPGSNLAQLPVGLDFTGISVAEGLRAALAAGIFVPLDLWLHAEPLLIIATAAMITCFCDVGGTLRQRLPMLLSFTLLGALTWAVFGLLREAGLWPVLLASVPAVFLLSMARVWGLRAQTVGNIVIVVLALAVDHPLTGAGAALVAGCFVAGGLWACLLTLVIWRIQPDKPVTQAVEQAFGALAELAGDLRALVIRNAASPEWDAHARAHRRAVRAAIENARDLVAGAAGQRGLASGRSQKAALLTEAADQLFGELIVLSEMLEAVRDAEVRAEAERLLRRVRPILRLLAQGRWQEKARLTAALERASAIGSLGELNALGGLILDRLRVLVRVADGPERTVQRAATTAPEAGWWRAAWSQFRGELTLQSAILRHASRATLLTVPAIAIALIWWTPYAHWLSITVALTMQPFFAATWQRALERIGGTVLGALLGGALAFLPETPLALGSALVVLSVIGFSVRQVSYGAYIACLTPFIVLLFDIAQPGHGPWMVAGMRTLYTLIGGVVAVTACMVLWPSWEPDRLRRELRGTLLAYARLGSAILADPSPTRASATEDARRAAGLANSNLEASLSRALHEPGRRHRAEVARLLAADALLRRLGATMLAMPHDLSIRPILEGPARLAWQRHVEAAFMAMAEGRPPPTDAALPPTPENSTLGRVRRGIDLLTQDLLRLRAPG